VEIVAFEPDMAEEVAARYHDAVAGAPFCAPIGGHWFSDRDRLRRQPAREEELLVAREGREAVGFVHAAVAARATADWHLKREPGVIRFLAYRPGERLVGQALLEAAERWLRDRGRRTLVAGHCAFMYPFYHLPFGHLSERIAHLPPLLGLAGYVLFESEVFLAWPDYEPPAIPPLTLEVRVVVKGSDDMEGLGPGVAVRAVQDTKRVGECNMVWLSWEGWRPELAGWCFCSSLHIEEPFQGQGLGKHLLARGLAEMRAAGARHAMISTDADNHRAYLFYANFGFRFLDRTLSFRRPAPRRRG